MLIHRITGVYTEEPRLRIFRRGSPIARATCGTNRTRLSVLVLQGVVTRFTRADADYVFHVVDEYFPVTDMPCIQRAARRRDHFGYGYFADDHFDFDLGQQIHIHLDASVIFARALLHAAAEYLRDRDTRHADSAQ